MESADYQFLSTEKGNYLVFDDFSSFSDTDVRLMGW